MEIVLLLPWFDGNRNFVSSPAKDYYNFSHIILSCMKIFNMELSAVQSVTPSVLDSQDAWIETKEKIWRKRKWKEKIIIIIIYIQIENWNVPYFLGKEWHGDKHANVRLIVCNFSLSRTHTFQKNKRSTVKQILCSQYCNWGRWLNTCSKGA